MEARDYEELKERLCEELEEIADSKSFGMAEIEIIDKLTHSIKNIDKIQEVEGYSYARDRMSRDSGRTKERYSYSDESEVLMGKIQKMIDDSGLSLDDKSALIKAMDALRK